jgi:hypothetical protein
VVIAVHFVRGQIERVSSVDSERLAAIRERCEQAMRYYDSYGGNGYAQHVIATDIPALLAALADQEARAAELSRRLARAHAANTMLHAERAGQLDAQLADLIAQIDQQRAALTAAEAANARLRAVFTRLLDKIDELDDYSPPRWAGAPEEIIPAELESIIIETRLLAQDARAALVEPRRRKRNEAMHLIIDLPPQYATAVRAEIAEVENMRLRNVVQTARRVAVLLRIYDYGKGGLACLMPSTGEDVLAAVRALWAALDVLHDTETTRADD